ncbi:hypothetical protein SAMN04489864_102124 [Pedobacter insulae]|uniref:YdbS-like PH domain-containing protein n=2 Tax=Pedobacter insulae TaxID=414048 RepID=A0A1I2UGX5_9SPHI|nr:hypothetical protein SAMN04489864_102124 [Pedobacter insulae]
MSDFTNNAIEIDQLPKYQEVRLNSLHPNYWKVILINISISFLLCGVGLAAFIYFNERVRPYAPYLIGTFVLVLILVILLYRASFKKRGFSLREKDIIYKSGIIAETTSVIPFNRIQHVALNEGMFSRMYRLATLQIYTAGGSSGHMSIAGIPADQAKPMKEALLKKLSLVEQ